MPPIRTATRSACVEYVGCGSSHGRVHDGALGVRMFRVDRRLSADPAGGFASEPGRTLEDFYAREVPPDDIERCLPRR